MPGRGRGVRTRTVVLAGERNLSGVVGFRQRHSKKETPQRLPVVSDKTLPKRLSVTSGDGPGLSPVELSELTLSPQVCNLLRHGSESLGRKILVVQAVE